MNGQLVCEFLIAGKPVPQGSKTARVIRTPKGPIASLYNDNDKTLKPWRKQVTLDALAGFTGDRLEGPVGVEVEFRFDRPKTVTREHMTVKPDIDKLQRALFDGITDAGVWRDDSQIVSVAVDKVYAAAAGVHVRIYTIEGTV